MNKPITVAREDFAQALIKLTNETPLPAFVKIDVLSGVTKALEPVAMEEYNREKKAWDESQKEEEDVSSD